MQEFSDGKEGFVQLTNRWSHALEALQALGRHYGPEMVRVAAELGVPEWQGWLLIAPFFEPQPISASRLRVRAPYTAARAFEQRLAMGAEKGFLAPAEEETGGYRLTEKGKQAAKQIIQAAYEKMAQLQPLPDEELERLAALLNRLVAACLEAPEPPGKWCIRHSRKTDPGATASLVIRIDQYLSDLAAYRDDAHLAAWQPYAIEGHAWEAFTFLWRGEAATLDELMQKLARRGYTHQEYQQALEELIRRGWVEKTGENYALTAEGKALRQQAEETTDRYFYAPWESLSLAEVEELTNLLTRFTNAISQV